MDEPTNHLDAAARRWLAEYIADYSGTVLVVSHDESFVSVACNSIADVDGGRLQLYQSTPFSRYVVRVRARVGLGLPLSLTLALIQVRCSSRGAAPGGLR